MSDGDVNKNIVISRELCVIMLQLLERAKRELDYNAMSFGELREKIREFKEDADGAITQLKNEIKQCSDSHRSDDGSSS